MDTIKYLIDFILHIDQHLIEIMAQYQVWTFLILFAIVFCETGLVVTPFLPGDSLLFASGAIIAGSQFHIYTLILILWSAGFIGDNVNYLFGRFLGVKVYEKNYRFIKRKYLIRTRQFYELHGGKTIVIARFMPIIRTFAPFVAGVGRMRYRRFVAFSFLGNALWVHTFCLAGFFFGNIPVVKNNFTLVIMAIIVISFLPPFLAFLKEKYRKEAGVVESTL